jgi:Uma2 family endonuclease
MADTSVYLTRGAEGLDRRGFTVAEIEKMIEAGVLDPDEKFELIDGEIVPMSPQLMPHMRMRMRVANWLLGVAPAGVEIIVEATLLLHDRQFFETDVLAFTGETERYVEPHMVKLAVEIAHTSKARDLVTKAPRYGEIGIPELWVVELKERQTYVFRGGRERWGQPRVVKFEEPLAPLFMPQHALRIADLEG